MNEFVERKTVYSFNVKGIHKLFQEGDAVFVSHHILGWSKVCFILKIDFDGILISYFNLHTRDYIEVFIQPGDFYNGKVEFFTISGPEKSEKSFANM